MKLLDALRARQVRLGVTPKAQLRYSAPQPLCPGLIDGIQEHKALLLLAVGVGMGSVLPSPLRRMVAACNGEGGPRGALRLPSGMVMNVQEYVLAVAASHACGNSAAESQLWEVYEADGSRW